MKMKSELLIQILIVQVETVFVTPESQESPEDISVVAGEHAPSHLDAAVECELDGRRRCRLGERATKRPSAQDVPMLNARASFESDKLVARSLGQPDVLQCHEFLPPEIAVDDRGRVAGLIVDELIGAPYVS